MNAPRPRMHHPGNDLRQCARAAERSVAPGGYDGASNRVGAMLLAKARNNASKLAPGSCCNNVGCGCSASSHAHVEGTVMAKREATRGIVDLKGGNAEIEYYPVHAFMPDGVYERLLFGKLPLPENKPACRSCEEVSCVCE